jgi:hypothetical protein
MIHPDTEVRYISPEVGYGVIALRSIPRGTVTWVQDPLDRTFPPEDLIHFPDLLREVLDKYCYRNRAGHYVFCWDHARFMNHSANSNCLLTPYGLEIAVRDIAEGEELTNDYGCFNIIEPFQPCPEEGGRDVVEPDDLARCHEGWDNKIRRAVTQLPGVSQPLQSLVHPNTWQVLCEASVGKASLDSVTTMLFREERSAGR